MKIDFWFQISQKKFVSEDPKIKKEACSGSDNAFLPAWSMVIWINDSLLKCLCSGASFTNMD